DWGAPSLNDVPVAADYDGDGVTDVGVYRMNTGEWFRRGSGGGTTMLAWGAPSFGDIPVSTDYDNDGKADTGIFRTSTSDPFRVFGAGSASLDVRKSHDRVFISSLTCLCRAER